MAVNQSLTLTVVSQSTEENTSKVRLLWQSVQTGGSYNMTTRTAYYYVSVNGEEETQIPISYVLPYRDTATLADVTITVPHDDSGQGKLSVRTWMNTNISAGVVELSKELTLPQIPRAGTLSAADGFIGERTRIAVSKKSSSFSHSIAYQFEGLSGFVTGSGQISGAEEIFDGDIVDFLLPECFYEAIPHKTSGQCVLTLRTYLGGTQIGQEQTAAFTVRTNEAVCSPVVSGTVTDSNPATVSLTGDPTRFIRYHSDALCAITAEARNGASITEKGIAGAAVAGSSLTVSSVEAESIRFYAKDSRGYESSVTVPLELVPYIRLTNHACVSRDDPTSGKATLILRGQVFTGSFGGQENTWKASYRVDGGTPVPVPAGEGYDITVPLTDMDYDSTHYITVTVEDALETAVKTLILPKGLPVFDWGEDDFAFHVPVKLDTPLDLGSGGTGKGSWETGVVVSDGQALQALNTLPIAQGGTGADTPENARKALGAAPEGLVTEVFTAVSMEQLEQQLQAFYGTMADGSLRYGLAYLGTEVCQILLWKSGGYGWVQLTDQSGAEQRMLITDSVWQSWEYAQPPMELGVEYRTTARWQRKPVYTKLIDFGSLPNNTSKSVAHGCDAVQILRAEGQASNGQAFPIGSPRFAYIALRAGLSSIEIHTDYNYSACTATVQLWYIKA